MAAQRKAAIKGARARRAAARRAAAAEAATTAEERRRRDALEKKAEMRREGLENGDYAGFDTDGDPLDSDGNPLGWEDEPELGEVRRGGGARPVAGAAEGEGAAGAASPSSATSSDEEDEEDEEEEAPAASPAPPAPQPPPQRPAAVAAKGRGEGAPPAPRRGSPRSAAAATPLPPPAPVVYDDYVAAGCPSPELPTPQRAAPPSGGAAAAEVGDAAGGAAERRAPSPQDAAARAPPAAAAPSSPAVAAAEAPPPPQLPHTLLAERARKGELMLATVDDASQLREKGFGPGRRVRVVGGDVSERGVVAVVVAVLLLPDPAESPPAPAVRTEVDEGGDASERSVDTAGEQPQHGASRDVSSERGDVGASGSE
eukprot:gene51979-39018_t